MKTIKIGKYRYETKEHDFGKCLKDIKIPKGWGLWTANDCIKLYNNKKYKKLLNLDDCWFFIKKPFKDLNSVAGFYADSVGAFLYCYGNPEGSDSSLGVRFKRRV